MKKKVLIVEDHPDTRSVLALVMERWGFEVAEARNGRDALIMVEQNGFDLMVVDMAMPLVDGFDFVRRVRNQLKTANIPIIAVTALDAPEDRDRCLQAGCNDYLPKPFSFDDLKAKIDALLGGK
ncbi:MAG: response regulator [Deltaproteobacteria bacterium]|nr:response regulator [Deltaproteobacteria bacterium]